MNQEMVRKVQAFADYLGLPVMVKKHGDDGESYVLMTPFGFISIRRHSEEFVVASHNRLDPKYVPLEKTNSIDEAIAYAHQHYKEYTASQVVR